MSTKIVGSINELPISHERVDLDVAEYIGVIGFLLVIACIGLFQASCLKDPDYAQRQSIMLDECNSRMP